MDESQLMKIGCIEKEKQDYVEKCISKITKELKPLLDFSVGSLDNIWYEFEDYTKINDIIGMKEKLETFLEELELLNSLLKDFCKRIMDVFSYTGRAINAQIIINRTFSYTRTINDIKKSLDLIYRKSEKVFKIRYDIPGSKEIVDLLEEIFNYGKVHFEYDPPEIKIEMDVSRDEEMARKLEKDIKSLSRINPEITITHTSKPVSSRNSTIIDSTISSDIPRSGRVEEAKAIVRDNPHIDKDTMHKILVLEGFSTKVIKECLVCEPKTINLSDLSFKELKNIVDLYNLHFCEMFTKSDLIHCIQENIEVSILHDIIDEISSK